MEWTGVYVAGDLIAAFRWADQAEKWANSPGNYKGRAAFGPVRDVEQATEALPAATGQQPEGWMPSECQDRDSCAKHGECMYLGCSGNKAVAGSQGSSESGTGSKCDPDELYGVRRDKRGHKTYGPY